MIGPGSETRRAARALVERRPVAIRGGYPVEESVRRLEAWSRSAAAARLTVAASIEGVTVHQRGDTEPIYRGAWKMEDGCANLEGEFIPPRGGLRVMKLSSIAFTALIALTAWAWLTQPDMVAKVSLTVLTVVCVLAFPYAVVGLSSQATARQAMISRAFERALRNDTQ